MQAITKLVIGLGFTALLGGCVVAPVAPGRAYVRVGPPVVAVRPYYYGGYYYGRRW
jgi:hypothetical protein